MIRLNADCRLHPNGAPGAVSRLDQDLARAASKRQDGADRPAPGEEGQVLIGNVGRNLHGASRSIQVS
jgi:hypothetical protein